MKEGTVGEGFTGARARSWLSGIAVVVIGMASGVAHATPTARVLDYGVFTKDPVPDAQADPRLGPYRLLEQTRDIPLRLGVRFGFCAEIQGFGIPDPKYTFTEIVRHPVYTGADGIEKGGWNVPRMVKIANDKAIWCSGHVFTDPKELVPGTWRFVVGDSDADVLVQEFHAVPAKN